MNIKNSKGITMVTLVVTIIVLLILAGVTLTMIRSDESIITQTEKAKAASIESDFYEKLAVFSSNLNIKLARFSTERENYDAKEAANMQEIKTFVDEEFKESQYKVVMDEANHKFTITYEAPDYKSAKKDNSAKITYELVITTYGCKIVK